MVATVNEVCTIQDQYALGATLPGFGEHEGFGHTSDGDVISLNGTDPTGLKHPLALFSVSGTVTGMRRLLLILPLVVALALGGYVLSASTDNAPAPGVVNAAGAKTAEMAYRNCGTVPGTWVDCAEDKLAELLPTIGVPTAVSSLLAFYHSNLDLVGTNCHVVMHFLGRYAADNSASILEALDQAPKNLECQLGFQHGVIEQTISNAPTLEAAFKVCAPLDNNMDYPPLIIGECYHAVGHGVSTSSKDDVLLALKYCMQYATTEGQRTPCASGVIMTWSNLIGRALGGQGPVPPELLVVPADKQWTLCAIIDPLLIDGCTNLTAETVKPSVANYAAFGKYCKDVLKKTDGCVVGVGRLVGGAFLAQNKFLDYKTMTDYCQALVTETGDPLSRCLATALGSRANFNPDPKQVDEACAAIQQVPCAELRAGWDMSTKPRNSA